MKGTTNIKKKGESTERKGRLTVVGGSGVLARNLGETVRRTIEDTSRDFVHLFTKRFTYGEGDGKIRIGSYKESTNGTKDVKVDFDNESYVIIRCHRERS